MGGLSHKERVFLGVSLLHRYKNSRLDTRYEDVLMLLNFEDLKEAEILGKAMRFGAMFSSAGSHIPARLQWNLKRKTIRLILNKEGKKLYGKVVKSRFLSLAQSAEAKIEVI